MNDYLKASSVFRYGVVKISEKKYAVMRTAWNTETDWEIIKICTTYDKAVLHKMELENKL
jgi:hypothetical protein